MEDNNTYYKPADWEFHIGFKFEYLCDGEWHESEFRDGSSVEVWEDTRVRHLCHEDIVGCGWKPATLNNYSFKGKLDEYTISPAFEKYMIRKRVNNTDYMPIFYGTIRNRSELLRIMKMVGIEK